MMYLVEVRRTPTSGPDRGDAMWTHLAGQPSDGTGETSRDGV
jgi:hypothetical protein